MPEASLSDRLLRLANRLEQWLEQSTARRELPLRVGAYALLVGLMVGSNLAALVRWPVAAARNAWRGAEPPVLADAPADEPVAVTPDELDALVQRGSLVLVDVWAAWCGPCLMMDAPLKQLAARYAGRCRVVKLDAMAHAEAAEAYGVNGLPTLIVFDGGAEVDRHAGALSHSELKALIAPHVSAPTARPTAAPSVR
jgi:thioredoxin